ncbi:MAG: HDIG domain-containing protein [Eubacteriales bacterium]|nr:HDIG domain-containing protein [Eubacteriales bacterium]
MNTLSLYRETDLRLRQDDKPSEYLNAVSSDPVFRREPFDMLYKLQTTEQSPVHHPEGSVWNHTMLVTDEAARVKPQSRNLAVFMWAALLHDIGKPATTRIRKGKITAYDHDKVGAELAESFLREFTDDLDFIRNVSELIRYHMQILYVLRDLPFADIKGMDRSTDIREVALLGLCDRMGRTNSDRSKEQDNMRLFLKKCNHVLSKKRSSRFL